ncbi:amidohydrolase family protein [Dactylosporangium sp. NPDC051485]|uniref:amidohydrolase family protein n=1 Tax=Dactylosporangium sp. NPDC051485 TaxID=3154846 RepID=UPI00343DD3FE
MTLNDSTPPDSSDDYRYPVISSDSHAGADLRDYKPFLEKKWHDDFDVWVDAYTNPWDFVDPRLEKDGFDFGDEEILTGAASWHSALSWDSERRISHMDQDGIAGEVIFPNTAPPFMPGSVFAGTGPASRTEYEQRFAGLRAHNRWLADFCAKAPERRAGIGQVLLDDIDEALAEIRQIKALGLRGGVLLPMDSPSSDAPPIYVSDLDPVWALCEELDLPVHKHAPAPPQLRGAERGGPGMVAISMLENHFYHRRGIAHFIFSGVLERHPGLKVILTEGGAGWIPDHIKGLDQMYEAGLDSSGFRRFLHPASEQLSMKPSEYFARNFYLGASLFLPSEAKQRHEIGVKNIMWGVDYPHSEGTFPYSREAIAVTFHDTPPAEVYEMLCGTAAKVFDFDVKAIQAVADRIGPSVRDVRTVPSELPRVPEQTMSPVFA